MPPHLFYKIYLPCLRKMIALHQNVFCQNTVNAHTEVEDLYASIAQDNFILLHHLLKDKFDRKKLFWNCTVPIILPSEITNMIFIINIGFINLDKTTADLVEWAAFS